MQNSPNSAQHSEMDAAELDIFTMEMLNDPDPSMKEIIHDLNTSGKLKLDAATRERLLLQNKASFPRYELDATLAFCNNMMHMAPTTKPRPPVPPPHVHILASANSSHTLSDTELELEDDEAMEVVYNRSSQYGKDHLQLEQEIVSDVSMDKITIVSGLSTNDSLRRESLPPLPMTPELSLASTAAKHMMPLPQYTGNKSRGLKRFTQRQKAASYQTAHASLRTPPPRHTIIKYSTYEQPNANSNSNSNTHTHMHRPSKNSGTSKAQRVTSSSRSPKARHSNQDSPRDSHSNHSAAVTIDISAVQTQTQSDLLHVKRYSAAHMPPKSPNTPPPNHNLVALSAPHLTADSVLSTTAPKQITSNTAVTTPMSMTPPHQLNPAYSSVRNSNTNTTASSASESADEEEEEMEQEEEEEEEERVPPPRMNMNVTIDTTPNITPIPFKLKRRSQTPQQSNSRIPDFDTHAMRSSTSNTIGMKSTKQKAAVQKRFSEVYQKIPQHRPYANGSAKKSGHRHRASDSLHMPSFQMVTTAAADGGRDQDNTGEETGNQQQQQQRQLMWMNMETKPNKKTSTKTPSNSKLNANSNADANVIVTKSAPKSKTKKATTKVMCICGQRLFKVKNSAQLLCNDDDDQISCSECGVPCPQDESLYHCRRKAHAAHPNGYNLCLACGKRQKRQSVKIGKKTKAKAEKKTKKRLKKKAQQSASDGLQLIHRDHYPQLPVRGLKGSIDDSQLQALPASAAAAAAYKSKLSIEYNTEEFHVFSNTNRMTPYMSVSATPLATPLATPATSAASAVDNEDNFSLHSYSLNTEKRVQLGKPLPFPVKRGGGKGGGGARGRGATAPLRASDQHPLHARPLLPTNTAAHRHHQRVSRPPPTHRHTATVASIRDIADHQRRYQRSPAGQGTAISMVDVLETHSKKHNKVGHSSRQSFSPEHKKKTKKRKQKPSTIFPHSSQSVPQDQSRHSHASQVYSDGLELENEYAIEVEEDGLVDFIFVSSISQ